MLRLLFLLDDIALQVYEHALFAYCHLGTAVDKVAGAVVLAGEHGVAVLIDIAILAVALDGGDAVAEGELDVGAFAGVYLLSVAVDEALLAVAFYNGISADEVGYLVILEGNGYATVGIDKSALLAQLHTGNTVAEGVGYVILVVDS